MNQTQKRTRFSPLIVGLAALSVVLVATAVAVTKAPSRHREPSSIVAATEAASDVQVGGGSRSAGAVRPSSPQSGAAEAPVVAALAAEVARLSQAREETKAAEQRQKELVGEVILDKRSATRVDVDPGSAPTRGPADAPIKVVLFGDYQCAFCAKLDRTLRELERRRPDKLQVAFKQFPLPFHERAALAAEAALAAGAQGKYTQMHELLFENREALDRASLDRYATSLGIDMSRFKADLDGHRFAAAVAADMEEGTRLGVQGTPFAFFNGRPLSGAQAVDRIERLIESELAP